MHAWTSMNQDEAQSEQELEGGSRPIYPHIISLMMKREKPLQRRDRVGIDLIESPGGEGGVAIFVVFGGGERKLGWRVRFISLVKIVLKEGERGKENG